MKKKIILGLLAIIIFLNIMISLVFAANASIDVINLDCNGAVISVKSDSLILTFNDNDGDKLYKIPANLKNYI